MFHWKQDYLEKVTVRYTFILLKMGIFLEKVLSNYEFKDNDILEFICLNNG